MCTEKIYAGIECLNESRWQDMLNAYVFKTLSEVREKNSAMDA
jgi:hypothetical protein